MVRCSAGEHCSVAVGAMECLGALDQGTQSTKFTLFDRELKALASASRDHRQIYPHSGWCEHDPNEIWHVVCSLMDQVLGEVRAKHGEVTVRSVGVANQRETILIWDREQGQPLYNAIVWLDGRTVSIVEDLIARYGGVDAFRPITGLPINTYFSGTKLKWLFENVPEISAAAKQGTALIGTIDSWLVWKLTGGINGGCHVTDLTNASRTLLMDIRTCEWSEEMCQKLGVPKACLPSIRSCSEVFGTISAKNEGLSGYDGVLISGIAGDQQASCIGHGVFRKGEMKCTYGTSASILINTGQTFIVSSNGLVTTPCFQLGMDQPVFWALEGTIAIAGAGVTWLKDSVAIIESPKETEALLNQVDDTDGVAFVPAFTGLYAPRWRADARGCIVGMTMSTTRQHIVRALFESIGFQTHEIIEAIKADTHLRESKSMKVDGGMSKNDKFLQLVSDITDLRIERVADAEATTIGIAVVTGLGCGFWSSFEDVEQLLSSSVEVWNPRWTEDFRRAKTLMWNKAVEHSLDWVH